MLEVVCPTVTLAVVLAIKYPVAITSTVYVPDRRPLLIRYVPDELVVAEPEPLSPEALTMALTTGTPDAA
jgi:hypothetical protein